MQPDVGATLEAIEVASSRKATRIGKPELFCFQTILEDYFLEDKEKWTDQAFLDQFLMVGDNLETDILFGKSAGIKTCFVYSGITKYPPSDLISERLNEIQPNHILQAFTMTGEV